MFELLFVYGSLKRFFNRQTLLANNAYLGTAKTSSEYQLFDSGNGWPALTRKVHDVTVEEGKVHAAIHVGGMGVFGELYQVEEHTLERLDEVEGAPHLFNRELIEIGGISLAFLPTEKEVFERVLLRKAICYLYQRPTEGLIEVPSGFWAFPKPERD